MNKDSGCYLSVNCPYRTEESGFIASYSNLTEFKSTTFKENTSNKFTCFYESSLKRKSMEKMNNSFQNLLFNKKTAFEISPFLDLDGSSILNSEMSKTDKFDISTPVSQKDKKSISEIVSFEPTDNNILYDDSNLSECFSSSRD